MTNFWTWCLQVAILVASGAAVVPFLKNARARLFFWQGLLVLAILLPMVQTWEQPLPVAEVHVEPLRVAVAELIRVTPTPFWLRLGWTDLLIAGALLRFTWLGIGLLRLWQLRRRAERIDAPVATYDAQVEWYRSPKVNGPVTFGRTVLLPERVLDLPMEMRHAIARHELLHIERGDWWFVMAEEVLRGVLWFHPAVWYALSQVQLAREQVVDREVVDGTRDQAGYLEALVAVAAQKMRADISSDIAPAPLFLRKRQLAVRVAAMLQEVPMSKSKLLTRAVGAVGAVALTLTAVVWMFPMVGSAQTLPDGPGVMVNAGATLLHRTPVYAPPGVAVTGTVALDATLNAKGEVTDARVVSGPEELRKAVLANVLNWHYASPTPTSARVTVTFMQVSGVVGGPGPTFGVTGVLVAPPPPPPPGAGGRGGPPPPPPPPPPPGPGTIIDAVVYQGMSAELQQQIERQIGLKAGDPLTKETLELRAKLQVIDEHLSLRLMMTAVDQRLTAIFALANAVAVETSPLPPPIQAPLGIARMSLAVMRTMIESRVPPVYPPIAMQARVQGTLLLSVVIGKDGRVEQIQVISGPAMLRQAAIDAVRQWTYKPMMINGQATQVLTDVEVNFALQ